MNRILLAVLAFSLSRAAMADPPAAYAFVDFAGATSAADYKDGRGTAARFWNPTGIARRPDGTLVVADTNNHAIREISPDGQVTTLAGGASPQTVGLDGRGVHARLQFPTGAAMDDKGNVYFYEPHSRKVRRVRPDGTVETHAGFYGFFTSISSDSRGRIYVLSGNSPARVNTDGTIDVLEAGTGADAMAVADDGTLYFSYKEEGVVKVVPAQGPPHLLPTPELGFTPENLIVLKNGDVLVCDVLTNQIYRYKPDGRHFYEPFVYPDPADPILGRLRNPRALLEAPNGDIYVADSENNAIRRYGADNVPATHAGVENPRGATDGPVASARFRSPQHAIESAAGTTYVTDSYACTIRAISDGVVTTLAGKPRECSEVDGPRDVARLYYPSMLAHAPNGDLIFTSWSGSIRKVAPDGTVATLRRGASHATGLAVSKSGEVFFASLDNVYKLESDGTRTLFSDLSSRIESIVFDEDGMLLVATGRGVFRVDSSGNPSAFDSQLWGALGMLMEPGAYLLVADYHWNLLFRYDREGRGRALSSRLSSTGIISPFGSLEAMSRRRDGLILTTDFRGAAVRLAVPALADRATIDAPFGPRGEERLLRPHPRTGAEHAWELVRWPTGSRSQPRTSTLGEATFLPDVEGFYVFRLTAKGPGPEASVSEVSFRTRDSAAASFAAVPRCGVEDDSRYIRAVWSTFVVGPGACGIPATATALVLEVTVPEPKESGAISLSPDIGAAPHPGAIRFKRAPRSAQVVVDLSPEGQFRIDLRDPALPGVAEYVDVDIVGYFGEVPQSRNPPRITP